MTKFSKKNPICESVGNCSREQMLERAKEQMLERARRERFERARRERSERFRKEVWKKLSKSLNSKESLERWNRYFEKGLKEGRTDGFFSFAQKRILPEKKGDTIVFRRITKPSSEN
jgi:hypothetical protein